MSPPKLTIERTPYGAYIEAEATADELVAGRLVEPEGLLPGEFGKSGQRTRDDEFGNRVMIKRRPRRDLLRHYPDARQ